jgi:hypothetical protein
VTLLLIGCAYRPAQGPPVENGSANANANASAANAPARLRLGWVTWPNDDTLVYCNRRLDDAGNPVGVTGPCFRQPAEKEPHRMVAFTNVERPDPTPPDRGPWPACRIELEAAQLVPAPTPARAWLVAPSGRTLLEEWTPPADVNGDAFQLEATFSPKKTWMALTHLAIGLGEGERSIEIAGATIRRTPPCP